MDDIDRKEIGRRVAHVRKQILKLSQTEIGKKLNISREEVSRIERGIIPLSKKYAYEIGKMSNVNSLWILNESDTMSIEEARKEGEELERNTWKYWKDEFIEALVDQGFFVHPTEKGYLVEDHRMEKGIITFEMPQKDFEEMEKFFRWQTQAVEGALAFTIIDHYEMKIGI